MALAVKRHLGVSHPTAWLLHHKISHVMIQMIQRETCHRLAGDIEIDDAYLGGGRAGGKVGRGSGNKLPFVAAISLTAEGWPLHIKLNVVSGFTLTVISKWSKASLIPEGVVTSDGLACFSALTDAGCLHTRVVVGDRKPRDLPQFKWVNTVLGNLKTTLAGAFHSLKYRKYAASYRGAFAPSPLRPSAHRFNWRFDLRNVPAADAR